MLNGLHHTPRRSLAWILPLVLALAATGAFGQAQVPAEEYRARRQQLATDLDGLVVLYAAPAIDLVEFQQEDNFYYLTGFDEPGAILLIDARGDAYGEVLFLPPRDLEEERWTGAKLGPGEETANRTGFARVEALDQFRSRFGNAVRSGVNVYTMVDQAANLEELRRTAPRAEYTGAADAIARLRQVKSENELAVLEKAVEITMDAHRAAAGVIAPGAMEYEVEAVIEYEFRRNGAQRPAFPSIVGSGPYSTVLHYDRNNRQMLEGDLVVADVGAEYGGYAADITRTYPVSGRFTPRQREIYQVVLDAQRAALARVRAGARLGGPESIHAAAREYIESKGYGEYFIHGTSHHLGLRVHDVGDTRRPLEPNMVITVEPGIYIPEENIGIRIEDDVVVTEDGYRLLSDFPKEPDEIEALMARQRGR